MKRCSTSLIIKYFIINISQTTVTLSTKKLKETQMFESIYWPDADKIDTSAHCWREFV